MTAGGAGPGVIVLKMVDGRESRKHNSLAAPRSDGHTLQCLHAFQLEQVVTTHALAIMQLTRHIYCKASH